MCKFVAGLIILFLAILCSWGGKISPECVLIMYSIGVATLGAGADAYKKELQDKKATKEKK